MSRLWTIPILTIALAATLWAGGCTQLPDTMVVTPPPESQPPRTPARNIDAIARQLEAVEERLASLAREVEVSGQRSLRNQNLLNELSARLSAMEGREPGAIPAGEKEAAAPDRELGREELYLSAYRAYLSGDYPLAIQQFSRYVASYPQSRLSDNALYWMGDAYYKLEDFSRAIELLNRVEQEYPRANRVPYALYRLGLIHGELGDRAAAETQFRRLMERYPRSDPARLASIRVEKLEREKGDRNEPAGQPR